VAFSFTVTAQDQFNNTASSYAGTAHFTSSDGQAVLPGNSALTNGVGTFSATLVTAGNQTITATDTTTSSITGTSNTVAVKAAAATHFAVSAPSSATAGVAFSFTVTAQDQFNNTATGYGGTVHFTSSDGNASLPANSTLSNGAGTFSATLKTAASQTVTATDTVTSSITGTSNSIAVSAAAATHFTVSAPASATAGSAFSLTVTAQDQFNNTATGYGGTAHFASSDGQAVLPANSTLSNGVGTFSVTLETAGGQTVTATDTVSSSIAGTSNTIAVSPAAATHFTVSAPATATAGTAFSFTVTALDPFNNTATGYAGTVHFTSTDGQAVLPGDSTLTNGVGTFSAALETAGGQTVTATDTVTSGITGTSNAIAVSPAAVIAGTGGDDSLVLTRTAGGGAGDVTYVLNGGAPVSLSGVTSFTFDGGAGDDTLTVGYGNGPPLLSGGVAFDAGAGVDALVVDGSAGTAATTLTVTDGQVTTQDGTATVAVRYRATGGSFGSVEALTGAGDDTALIQSTPAGATTAINTGGGNDVFYVSSAVGNSGNLDGIRGSLLIDAGAGSNFLVVSDAGGSGPDTLTLTGNSIADTAVGFHIGYQASGGSFAGVNLATGPGAVRVNVQSTAAGALTGVLNLGGADTIDVCSDTAANQGDLSGLKGTLLVEALGGTDLLVVSEAGRQTGDDVVVTAGALGSRDGAGFTIYYTAAGGSFSGINFASGSGDDHFTVQGAPAGVPLALYTRGGNDAVVVGVTADSGYDLTVVGGPSGGAVLGVADLSGTAALDNLASGLDSGLVRALYAGKKPSTITYRDVDQVFTSPAAG
jgi:hypothetical protein